MPKKKWEKLKDEDDELDIDLDLEGFGEDFDFDSTEEVDTGVGEPKVRQPKEMPPGKLPFAICFKCPLINSPMVPSYGPDNAKVILVGEAPGMEEVAEKRPFVGMSGKLLREVVSIAGFNVDDAYVTNAVQCRPPGNRTPKAIEVRCCHKRLLHEISLQKDATVVIALGKVANKIFNKGFQPGDRGLWKYNEDIGKDVMGTWHPAYVLRKPNSAVQFIPDVRKGFTGKQAMERFLKPPDVVVIRDLEHLRQVFSRAPDEGFVAYDLETDNVVWYDRPAKRADSIILLAMCWSDDYAIIIDDALLYDVPGIKEEVQEFFNRKELKFCGHNGKFDQEFLAHQVGIKAPLDFDTMLAHYVLDENSPHGLKLVAREVFGLFDYEKELIQQYLTSRNDSYSKVPFPELSQYAAWDVVVTRALAERFEVQLKNEGLYDWPFMNIMMPASHMFLEAELRGIQTDLTVMEKAYSSMVSELESLEKEASSLYMEGINLNSPVQVCHLMYDVLKLPVPVIDGRPWRSSARAAVNALVGKNPFVDLLIYYRRIGKLKSSYIENMMTFKDVNGRIHPTFWLHGTEMGRISARDPAVQTIPRPGDKWIETIGTRTSPLTDGAMIRGAIKASPGNLLSIADYSQAELRTVAVLAQEPFLLDVYRSNRDLHTEVAVAMYGPNFQKEERQRCKMFNFSYIYGGNEYSFARDAGLDVTKAREFVHEYNKVMPELAKYRVSQYNFMLENGYVQSIFGRRRRFVLITSSNKDDARKACVHAPVAGTASDLTMISAIECWRDGIPILMTVHDSVISDTPAKIAPEVTEHISRKMEEVGTRYLPEIPWKTDMETVTHWAEAPVL